MIKDFYEPCLAVAASYDRAVGYFTSHGLALAARGLEAFASGGHRMRLVASPVLSEEDLDAIDWGLLARERIVERRLLEALRDGGDSHTVALAWLVAESRLEIQIAVPRAGPGIYHEKAGLFHDADGCVVAFSGSANETVGGLVSNFEAIDVFFSWDGTRGRVARKAANFERLWTNDTPELDVMPLPAAVERELIMLAEQSPRGIAPMRPRDPLPAARPGRFAAPANVEPRPYQSAAIEAWFAAGARGMLSMATGTGKTKTALFAATELFGQQGKPPCLVIVTPYIHLVDQWAREIEAWGLRPTRCYEAGASWEVRAWEAVDSRRAGASNPICLIATIATATGPRFLRLADRLPADVMFIADEVHHLGADQGSSILRDAFPFRLGLSATPERWGDEVGNRALETYFGKVVFEFGIGAAIAARCLARMNTFPSSSTSRKTNLRLTAT